MSDHSLVFNLLEYATSILTTMYISSSHISLVTGPFPPLVFNCLQYANLTIKNWRKGRPGIEDSYSVYISCKTNITVSNHSLQSGLRLNCDFHTSVQTGITKVHHWPLTHACTICTQLKVWWALNRNIPNS